MIQDAGCLPPAVLFGWNDFKVFPAGSWPAPTGLGVEHSPAQEGGSTFWPHGGSKGAFAPPGAPMRPVLCMFNHVHLIWYSLCT